MKRSGDVTAAAIVMFFGSGLLLLLLCFAGLVLLLPTPENLSPGQQYQGFVFGVFMYGGLAAWGIATAIGILGLRNWARISVLIMAGLAIACLGLAEVSMFLLAPMMSQMPGMNATGERVFLIAFSVMAAFPIGISIWWLALFTRKRVVAEFGGEPFAARPDAGELSAALAGNAAPPAAVGSAGRTASQQTGKIPVSIIVIAVFLLIGVVFLLPSIIHAYSAHIPFVLFGVFLSGGKGLTALVVMTAIQLLLGLALLFRKAWSLNATIVYAVLAMSNGILFLASSSRDAYFQAVFRSYQAPPNFPPDFFPRMMHSFMPLVMGFTVAVNLVGLYFLWTRREAYRAACAAKV